MKMINKNLNHPVEISGIILTMYDKREKLSREIVKEVRRYFPDKVFETVIPRQVKLAEASSFSKPIVIYAPNSKACRAYFSLADEIIEKRKPLSQNAKRAGWIGCNILFQNIPQSGKIFYVQNKKIVPQKSVLEKWNRTL